MRLVSDVVLYQRTRHQCILGLVAKNIESAEVRSRQMARKLKSVEALPSDAAQLLLGKHNDDADADLP